MILIFQKPLLTLVAKKNISGDIVEKKNDSLPICLENYVSCLFSLS